MNKKLHIISFDIPCPPDYGNIIDIFFKLKYLAKIEIDIILHCFQYKKEKSADLEKICHQVHYYPRQKNIFQLFSSLPFIVKSRRSKKLLQNLQNEVAPILFEGLHSCYYINHPRLHSYQKIVRTQNIEHNYYRYLALTEQNIFYRYYLKQESFKLRCFEKKIKHASQVLSISPSDTQYFKTRYEMGTYIPVFHPFENVKSKLGMGDFILFHGNLSSTENIKSVNYLLNNIFSEITIPVMIAGKNPPDWLVKKISDIPHVSIIGNPDMELMNQLIQDAQINFLPSFQSTGVKLKLLASLFLGRHCITNSLMVDNTGLESLCYVENSAPDIIKIIQKKFEEPITPEEISQRKKILENQFSNTYNAEKIYQII